MLHICICDDSIEQLEAEKKLTAEYIKTHGLEAETEVFSHPDKLLSALETKQFHLYLLDIVMPMTNGIDIGKAVRRYDPAAQIIYITSAPEYAIDSFAASPIDYLLKPIAKDKLFHAIDKALQKMDLSPQKTMTIKTKDGIHTVFINQILYLEYVRHTIVCVLSNGERIQSATIKESFSEYTQSLMQNSRFIQPHSSFVVNMQYVERLNKDGFQLKGKHSVPISGKKYVEIRDRYLNFRLEV